MTRYISLLPGVGLLLFPILVVADGPADNIPTSVRRIPKLGVDLPAEKRQELEAGLTELRNAIDELRQKDLPRVNELLPDVEIFYKAVHDALV